jgi:dUTP pyrophosphatase
MSERGIDIPIRMLSSRASLPKAQTKGSAGFDLSASEAVTLQPGRVALVPTGLAVAIPEGYEGQVRPRSGLALRHAIGVLNAPGTIDADYRGEVQVLLFNFGAEPFEIEAGARIAQLVIQRVVGARFVVQETLDETDRGEGGFGHTGH